MSWRPGERDGTPTNVVLVTVNSLRADAVGYHDAEIDSDIESRLAALGYR